MSLAKMLEKNNLATNKENDHAKIASLNLYTYILLLTNMLDIVLEQ